MNAQSICVEIDILLSVFYVIGSSQRPLFGRLGFVHRIQTKNNAALAMVIAKLIMVLYYRCG